MKKKKTAVEKRKNSTYLFEFPVFVKHKGKKLVALWNIKATNEELAKNKFVRRRGQNLTFDELLLPTGNHNYKTIDAKPYLDNEDFLNILEVEVDRLIDEGTLIGHKVRFPKNK